jgi:copper(I)-binding protein
VISGTPNAPLSGADYLITASNGTSSASATVSLFVNGPPVLVDAGDTSVITVQNASAISVALGSYVDDDSDPSVLKYVTVASPTKGTLSAYPSIVPSMGTASITYSPTSYVAGSDSFTYMVCDAPGATQACSASVTVNIIIQPKPTIVTAAGTTVNATEDTATTIDLSSFTEYGAVQSSLSYVTVTPPTKGTLGLYPSLVPSTGTTTVNFTPTANVSGTDSFVYKVCDGEGGSGNCSENVSVSISIAAVNDAPTMTNIADQSTNTSTAITGITFSIADIDSTVTCAGNVSKSSSNTGLLSNTNIAITESGTNCSMTLTPTTGQGGTSTVTLSVSDDAGGSAQTSFVFNVAAPLSITSVSPDYGPLAGGTTLTVNGTDFQAGMTITLGTNNCTNVNVLSPTQLTCTIPAETTSKVVNVSASDGTQNASLSNGYVYGCTTGSSPFGEAVSSSLTSGAVKKCYFRATSGDQIFAQLGGTTANMDIRYALKTLAGAASGTGTCSMTNQSVPTSWYGSASGLCAVNSTGIHSIDVDNSASENGNYTYTLQRLNSPVNASTTITPGTAQTGLSVGLGRIVMRSFTGNEGDKILVSAANTVGNAYARFRIRVFGPSGTMVTSCDNSYDSAQSWNHFSGDMTCTLSNSGTHFILATNSDTNQYRTGETITLHFDFLKSNVLNSRAPFGALASTPGTAETGIQIPIGQIVARTFSGTQGDKILVSAANTVGKDYARFRTRVYSLDGTLVTSCDKSYTSTDIWDHVSGDMTCTLSSTGDHVILMSLSDYYQGAASGETITLHFDFLKSNVLNSRAPFGALASTPGTAETGIQIPIGQIVARTFSGTQGDKILVSAANTVGKADAKFRTRVYSQDGTLVTSCNNPYDSSGNWSYISGDMTCTLSSTGDHVILMSIFDGYQRTASGETITLHFDFLKSNVLNSRAPFGALAATLETAEIGIQIPIGQVVARTFSGNVGDKILVSAGNTVGKAYARFRTRVYSQDGTLVTSCNNPYDSAGNWNYVSGDMVCTLSSAGNHVILMSIFDGIQGAGSGETITLHFDFLKSDILNSRAPFGALAATPGTAETGMQIPIGQVVARSFTGNAGDKILVSAGNTIGNTSAKFRTRVFNSQGTLVTSCDKSNDSNLSFNYVSGDIVCTLTTNGQHYILATLVDGSLARPSETINLFLENITSPASASIVSGSPPSGTMVLGVPWVRKFTVTAGQTASASLATTANIRPRVRIIAPNGTAVCNTALSNLGTASFSNCSLTQTGVHLMIYSPNDGVHSGYSTTPAATFTWNGP